MAGKKAGRQPPGRKVVFNIQSSALLNRTLCPCAPQAETIAGSSETERLPRQLGQFSCRILGEKTASPTWLPALIQVSPCYRTAPSGCGDRTSTARGGT